MWNLILLIGDANDLVVTYMGWLARRRGAEVALLSEASLGVDWRFAFDDLCPSAGRLTWGERTASLSAVAGAYVRFHPEPELPGGLAHGGDGDRGLSDGDGGLSDGERAWFVSERRTAIQHLANSLPCPVANRPRAGRCNGSKPYQMRTLADAGFRIPEWVVTSEPDVAEAFIARHPAGAIYKAPSGLRSRVRMADSELIARLRAGTTPVLLQRYVPGREVRVHTVADRAFATEVSSGAVDYRFAGDSSYAPADAPDDVIARCCLHAARAGMLIAGFDFRVTDAGAWYCLEMNPVPTFLPYEMATGQPIADALLDQLLPRAARLAASA